MLEREARIVRHTGRGCFVSETAAALPAAMISDFLGDMSRAGPADILELRMIVEPMAASIAAVRATARDIEAIERAARLIERAENLGDREDADANFHLALFQATRNPFSAPRSTRCATAAEWFERKRQILTPDRKNLYDHQHGEIVAALRRRDAGEVQTAMRSHLENPAPRYPRPISVLTASGVPPAYCRTLGAKSAAAKARLRMLWCAKARFDKP